MTYAEYLLTFSGHLRNYYLDYAKFRDVAYQTYLSQPRKDKALSIQKYMPLPTDGRKALDTERAKNVRHAALEKLRKEKDGKRS